MERCCECENVDRCRYLLGKSFVNEGPCDWEPSKFRKSEIVTFWDELSKVQAEIKNFKRQRDAMIAAAHAVIGEQYIQHCYDTAQAVEQAIKVIIAAGEEEKEET